MNPRTALPIHHTRKDTESHFQHEAARRHRITLTINGETATLEVPPERTLLQLIRGDLHLSGTKEGCGIGECGACTVIMDGQPINSCLVLAVEADGCDIRTVESEIVDGQISDIQQALIDFGATQCGFCTPGFVMSARALLERNPDPSREEIAEALAGNYCRCTGYEPIIDAVAAVARAAKSGGYRSPEKAGAPYVGGDTARVDGLEKVAGSAIYVHDMVLPGMLHARMKVSPHASARIVRIDTSKAEAMPGVRAVLTGRDTDLKQGLYMRDKDVVARDVVRYQGEPVAAVAADSEEIARAACEAIAIECEVREPIRTVQEALAEEANLVHENLGDYHWMQGVFFPKPGTNIAHHQKIRKGDVDQGFKEADRIFEFEFENPPVQHVAMETHTAIAIAKPGGDVELITSAQSPFTVRNLFSVTFGIPHSKIRVKVPYVGGGFGGKAGIHLEPMVYLLSKMAGGRPVKMTCTREEEFHTIPSRAGLSSHIKTGVTRDGKITALEIRYLWNAGAYADYGVNVGRAAAYSGAGPYCIDNCKLDSLVCYTNRVFGTAFRGFGHLEVMWTVERNMDLIARGLGIDPLEMRLKNVLRPGDTTITGELFTEGHGRPDLCLERVAEEIGWKEYFANLPKTRGEITDGKARGKGIALLHKAPAMPTFTSCAVVIKFNEDCSVNILVSGVDYGQGTYTALAQIAADELRIPVEQVRVTFECDTDFTPYDWQTVASRFTVMGGNATIQAAQDCLRQIRDVAAQVFRAPPEMIICENSEVWVKGREEEKLPYSKFVMGYTYPNGNSIGGPVVGRGRYIAQGLTNLDPETGQGRPALNWTYGAHGVEIEVDTETGEIEVLEIASAFDVGRVINEQQCRGQVIGGVVQGLGSALNEKFVFDPDGRFVNPTFTDYKIPTAKDIPAVMKQFFIETPHPQGPHGARGVAEHPMVSVPSVVGNALANATGVEVFQLPLDPEAVYLALKHSGDRKET
ncbi:molybdopterin-dependent oxidoreductase [Candidatus Sumerlaeota bacterium]|nr:molybdopterin-dependent oxidoreductase [Candidatus Sumerlaeota bacterium]